VYLLLEWDSIRKLESVDLSLLVDEAVIKRHYSSFETNRFFSNTTYNNNASLNQDL
jgi:hypothetical protein